MNILCTAPVGGFKNTVDFLNNNANTTFIEYAPYEKVQEIIHLFDGYMPNARIKVDDALLDKAKKLKVIYQPSLGKDHIDEKSCRERGIHVVGLVDDKKFQATLWTTAEFTLGLILTITKRLNDSYTGVLKNGLWRNIDFMGSDLRGKVVGIVGYGNIGSKLDHLLSTFGVKTLKCDPYIDQVDETYVSLNKLFQDSDIVTMHVSLTDETRGMIDYEKLSLMSSGFFINASRGPVLNDLDLIRAMKKGHIVSAALDVLNDESPYGVEGHPLVNFARENPRLFITPHLGGTTYEYLDKIFLHSAKELVVKLNSL